MKRTICAILAVAALALVFSTCKKPTTSVDECIDNFMSDINSSDRSGVYQNLDSDAGMYAAARYALYWDTVFPTQGIPYSLNGRSKSGDTVTGTISSSTYVLYSSGLAISFGMSEDGDGNAVIKTISLAGSSIFYNKK